jgi:coenzyme F420 hydrogenase subunit beta
MLPYEPRGKSIASHNLPDIFQLVVAGGYCVGCGGCAATTPKLRVKFDEFGLYKPFADVPLDDTERSAAAAVCPFLGQGESEDTLAGPLYASNAERHGSLGYHIRSFAGSVSEGTYRASGSSGGFGTWLPVQLLERGLVDAVIHVKERHGLPGDGPMFEYDVSSTVEEIRAGAKSRYYPIEISSVLAKVKSEPRRYAFVGLPCFVKTIRLLQKFDSVLAERIPFCIGIVCGHLKSKYYGEFLAWQCGVHPSELTSIDFRHKEPGTSAKGYILRAEGTHNDTPFEVKQPVSHLVGGNWGLGYFKNDACDFCDDVLAECADVAIGDAWLPEYVHDPGGNSILVVRSTTILGILADARTSGLVALDEISADRVELSQAAGIRHRREGLAYRLFLKQKAGFWTPAKRVQPTNSLPLEARLKYFLRVKLLARSHIAYRRARANNRLRLFSRGMSLLMLAYYGVIAFTRVRSKLAKLLSSSRVNGRS